MAKLMNVNPTRMELSKLKKRLVTAKRGHKLLKDKRDEMVKQFLELVRKDKQLRTRTEEALGKVQMSFSAAASVMSPQAMEEALIYPKNSIEMKTSSKNIMSVEVPVFDYRINGKKEDIYPYGYAFTTGEMDDAVKEMTSVLDIMIELAETEKAVMMLASDIEKTRRRVNALEHVMIPDLELTIKSIQSKLDENERGNTTRLMKVKDMVLQNK